MTASLPEGSGPADSKAAGFGALMEIINSYGLTQDPSAHLVNPTM